ncbi:SUF system NifU family Fe-S cluster assembly protein [Paenibacillus alkaliterrae]|uniref:Fe-S cluster assembly sulfur transfer protein SufU n=1 Tax=Paenibacillus alkaliterrae TaxID=320909 RepID=UPI001F3F0969|nr:SUF system NifU family Fe-S cluster assembly protein [Paenibacillus alkaliterrae]MCF2940327.1 SUF system NifU family Fe-S cluster assembly protein [Paenibacillus alkaliterrae]
MLDKLYQQLVLDHYKTPRNKRKLDGEGTIRLPYKNPTCGDVMVLYVNIQNDTISDITFEGEGCSISMASCSMMTTAVKGQSTLTAQQLIGTFTKMIKEGAAPPEPAADLLHDALSLAGVHTLRARHNCALMGWQALNKVLENRLEGKGE